VPPMVLLTMCTRAWRAMMPTPPARMRALLM
jgi:hypothetical protein